MPKIRILGLTVVALAALVLVFPSNAHATCGVPIVWGQLSYSCGGNFCYIVSPGSNDPSANLTGSYWSLTFGDPTVGLGTDNGSHPMVDWCRVFGPGCYISADWAGDPRIDGCINNQIPAGHTTELMGAVFTDTSADGRTGYFAAASVVRVASNPGSQFDFTFVNGGGTGMDIDLVPIPAPSITASSRVSDLSRSVTLAPVARPTSGYYSDGNATAAEVITGLRLYQSEQAFSNPPAPGPTTRTTAAGGPWTAASDVLAFDTANAVTVNCTADSNLYLAYSLVMDSGFETAVVSSDSVPVACGPNLADPGNRQFKLIDRKDHLKPRPQRER